MPVKLDAATGDFGSQLEQLLEARESAQSDVGDVVRDIIRDVRHHGDEAVLRYTSQFDRHTLSAADMRVTGREIDAAHSACDNRLLSALKVAAARIHDYSKKQLPANERYTDDSGVTLGWKWTPLDSAGLYVPGGLAAYPSSVLMNAIPAKVAGVERLVVTVPAPEGHVNPAVLAACEIAGVDEIYTIGGAQAVAALAYGTLSIRPVDKIVGPGNAYVAEAKRQVFGRVGIDMIAGPSEILVVADNKNDPSWIAADLLSQAEHDEQAQSILITNDATFAAVVLEAVESQLQTLPRAAIARASWENYGAVITVTDWDAAMPIINRIAAEHVELAVEKPDTLAESIIHAGAIFLGRYTPEAIGDYIAGPSHVLPTSRTARFSSGLSVYDFMKRTSLISCSPKSFVELARHGEALAEAEGLSAHRLSMSIRHNE